MLPNALPPLSTPVLIGARTLLTLPFWWSGVAKLLDFEGAIGEAAHFGLQPATPFAIAVILVQVVGSLVVIMGIRAWTGALALVLFTLAANVVGHAFWTIEDPLARFHDMNAFLANLGLVGGLGLAVALDAERGRRS